MAARSRALAAGLLLTAALGANAAGAAGLGLVVGINDYAAYPEYRDGMPFGMAYDLMGARNDAERIAEAMRDTGIDLPDRRLLLDGQATEAAFLAAWSAMLDEAQPGDTLIVTFAGHGAQETEASPPFDEADGRDEIIMFHDFDPQRPGTGRLTDDELRVLLEGASDYNVVWVMDACHSGGLTRSAARTLSRFGGLFEGLPDPALSDVPLDLGDGAANDESLPHVTQILATASEDLLVDEIEIDGEMHGALSWYFAEALSGSADADGDGTITRRELSTFLDTRVFARMNQSQQPRVLPRGDGRPVLAALSGASARPVRPQTTFDLPVTVLGADPPGLPGTGIRRVSLGAVLSFEEERTGRWIVRNQTGDRITVLDATGNPEARAAALPDTAAPFFARQAALDALKGLLSDTLPPAVLTARHGNGLMRIGERVAFDYTLPSTSLPYLTLFNIASNGALQALYPTRDDGFVRADGFSTVFEVTPPTGVDQLFAVACPVPPLDLRDHLQRNDGRTVTPALVETIVGRGCQVGTAGLYTDN